MVAGPIGLGRPSVGESILDFRFRGGTSFNFLIDDEVAASLRSPGFAHPTKAKFGFMVNGSTIDFDNLRVMKPKGNTAP